MEPTTFSIYQCALVSNFERLSHLIEKHVKAASDEDTVSRALIEQAASRLRLWSRDICRNLSSQDVIPSQVLQVLHDTQPESALVKTINDCFTDIILMMKPPGEREEQAGHGMEVDKTESTIDKLLKPFYTLSDSVPTIRKAYSSAMESQKQLGKVILSLDGGGIRSYSSLLILKTLMHHVRILREIDPQPTDPQPTPQALDEPDMDYIPRECFDYIFGTSSGGLIAIMLGRLRMPIQSCISSFARYSHSVFDHPKIFHSVFFGPRYKTNRITRAIKELVEEKELDPSRPWKRNIFASDGDPCRTAVLAFRKETLGTTEKLHLFRSYDHFSDEPAFVCNPGPAAEEPIWAIARAASAAPTYFSPITIGQYIYQDAGLGYNNPSIIAHQEVLAMEKQDQRGESSDYPVALLISIGTGARDPVSRFSSSWSLSMSIGNSISVNAGVYSMVRAAVSLATETQKTHHEMQSFARAMQYGTEHKGMKYFRFNVDDGLQHMSLDDSKSTGFFDRLRGRKTSRILAKITAATKRYLDKPETQKDLHEAAKVLIAARRSRTPAPITPLPPFELLDDMPQNDEALLAKLREQLSGTSPK